MLVLVEIQFGALLWSRRRAFLNELIGSILHNG
jgi:hypothetical protein